MRAIGAQLVGVSAAMMAPLALSTRTYAGFEKSMAKVDALTRGQATNSDEAAANFRKLTEEAKRLGEQTEYSASQAAEMMYEFAMRGYKVNEILAATGPALQMATAGNMELAEAAGIAGDIMGGMKIPATELGRVTDIMAKAFSTSATDLRQLGEAFKYVGPTASSMGFSVTEVTAALQVLADAGQKGEMAGTTLRGMLETLKDPSKEARDELNRLGVVLDNGQGKFRDLASIIGDMEKGLGKLSQVDAASSISRIFTNRQTTGTTILVTPDQTGLGAADRIRQKDKALQGAEGTGAAIQARQLDTLWGAWKLIESAIEGVAITIGETLAPTIREWASATIHGIGLLHEIIKANKDWIPVIAKTAVVVGGIGAALVTAGTAMLALRVAAVPIQSVFSAIGAILSVKVLAAVAAVGAAIGIAISAAAEMGASWEMVVPALKAVAGFAVAAGVAIALAVGVAVEVVKKVGTTIGKVLKETFPGALKSIGDAIGSVAAKFSKFFDQISETFDAAWGGIVNALKAGDLQLAAGVAMAGFKVIWQQGVSFLTGFWRDGLQRMVFWWYDAWERMALGLTGIWAGFESVIFESINGIYRAWGWLTDSMKRTMAGSTAAMSVMMAGVKAGVTFDLDFRKKIDEAAQQAVKDLDAEVKQIQAGREAEITAEAKRRDALRNKQAGVQNEVKDANQKAKDAFHAETLKQNAEATAKLTEAQKELAAAVRDAETAMVGAYGQAAGQAMLDRAFRSIGVEPDKIMSRVNQATGGVQAGAAAAGTFDSGVARFLGGTNNIELQLQQLRQQLEAQRQSKELLGYILKVLDDIRREGGGFFQ